MPRKFRQYVIVEYGRKAPPSALTNWMQAQVQAAAREWQGTTGSSRKRKRKRPAPNPDAEYYRAGELAQILNLSEDTIRRLFEDEPGVIVLGDKNPRGKRRRLTLRIPKNVFERVKKRLAN